MDPWIFIPGSCHVIPGKKDGEYTCGRGQCKEHSFILLRVLCYKCFSLPTCRAVLTAPQIHRSQGRPGALLATLVKLSAIWLVRWVSTGVSFGSILISFLVHLQ